jgi:uncharacterized OB-fold protein
MTIEKSRGGQQADDESLLLSYPDLEIDHDSKQLCAGWRARVLLMSFCDQCSRWSHPPRLLCPHCYSLRQPRLLPVSGQGRVHLVVGSASSGSEEPATIVAVDLVEQAGLRVTGHLVGAQAGAALIGRPVSLGWTGPDSAPFPVFMLDDDPRGVSP